MHKIDIKGATGTSEIVIGEPLQNLAEYLPADRAVIITDTTVDELYGARFPMFPKVVIGKGEPVKQLETVARIYREFVDLGIDRDTSVVGIGGGIVCDVTGFVASTYMRGLSFGFAPTTLLAQVDAAVGGKNGVNFGGFKNMIGTFNQPRFVVCDPSVLKTLSGADIANGLAEVVKHALIADRRAFEYLEDNAAGILRLEAGVIEKIICDSLGIKAGIVGQDELERGARRKLNFGHTLGHAVESVSGLAHGEAVSIGMAAAAALSVERGLIAAADAGRIAALLEKLGLPAAVSTDPDELIDKLRKDKKRSGPMIHFILLESIGRAVAQKLPLAEIEALCRKNQSSSSA